MSGLWSIEAVRYGTLKTTKSALFHEFDRQGEEDAPQSLDYWFYLLRDGDRTVVVDTGFASAVGPERGRTLLVDPAEVLTKLAVDVLLLTHLHYDHIGNIAAIGDVPIAVPAAELAFWSSTASRYKPHWQHTDPAGIAQLAEAQLNGRLTPFGQVYRAAPGIVAFTVGGHSPGQVIILVRGEHGFVLLCSDAVHLYEELEQRRPFVIFTDLVATYAAYEFIDALADVTGAVVIAGHDPLVASRFPQVEPASHGFRISSRSEQGKRTGPIAATFGVSI